MQHFVVAQNSDRRQIASNKRYRVDSRDFEQSLELKQCLPLVRWCKTFQRSCNSVLMWLCSGEIATPGFVIVRFWLQAHHEHFNMATSTSKYADEGSDSISRRLYPLWPLFVKKVPDFNPLRPPVVSVYDRCHHQISFEPIAKWTTNILGLWITNFDDGN